MSRSSHHRGGDHVVWSETNPRQVGFRYGQHDGDCRPERYVGQPFDDHDGIWVLEATESNIQLHIQLFVNHE